MKRLFIAILGMSVLFAACEKNPIEQIEQNPYRIIVEYTPGTATLEVPGALTPDASYDWISCSQSGDKVTFTMRRNTTGLVREADFTIAGSKQKAKVFQKIHSLDATLETSIISQGGGKARFKALVKTAFPDDYASWGVVYNTKNDIASGTFVPQEGDPRTGSVVGEISGLETGTDYFLWSCVISTEGDKVYSPLCPLFAPIMVRAGEDVMAAINECSEFGEIRLLGGVTFPGDIFFYEENHNKTISGGWNDDFSEQSLDNLTIIDGGGSQRGFVVAHDAGDAAIQGYVDISYFEIRNCSDQGQKGSALHVCGGPVTIHHCDMHDNSAFRGTIGVHMDGISSDVTVYNCKIVNNRSEGHGAAISVEDGNTRYDRTKFLVFNCLIEGNIADKLDGYSAAFYVYKNSEAVVVNNTFIANKTFNELNGNHWAGFYTRNDARALVANNIIVGNLCSASVKGGTPEWYREPQPIALNSSLAVFANNVIEDAMTGAENATSSGNVFMPYNFDLSEVITSDYMPAGKAVGLGSLGTWNYTSTPDYTECSLDIKALFEKYPTDLAGNPRVVNGKIDAGCYQLQ